MLACQRAVNRTLINEFLNGRALCADVFRVSSPADTEEELAGQREDVCHVFASERELQTCWPRASK